MADNPDPLNPLMARLLTLCQEKSLPSPLRLSNPLVVRQPWMWIMLFEHRDVKVSSFTSDDDTSGLLVLAFNEAVSRTFSCREDPPHLLDADTAADASLLSKTFTSIGTLYCYIPISADNPTASIDAFVRAVLPIIEEAKRILRRMNARSITTLGGSGARYLTTRLLDPQLFAAEDREALKKATTKAEAPLDTRGERFPFRRRRTETEKQNSTSGAPGLPLRPPRTCTKCKKIFTGSWPNHQRNGNCT